jgi:hypothetical protein
MKECIEILQGEKEVNKLMIICSIGIVTGTSLLIKDAVKCTKTKKMVKRTINNCFKILEEKEVK